MGFTAGIIGLPNVGKSTIFNALCAGGAAMANYPFTTIEPNRGVVQVPDERLQRIGELLGKEHPIPTTIEFTDVAGLVQGAASGEGLGNRFLGHIRTVDALIHVVRCFSSPDAEHVMGTVDPVRDAEIILTELVLADLEVLQRHREKLTRQVKSGDKQTAARLAAVDTMSGWLDEGRVLAECELNGEMQALIQEFGLITAKPVLYVANVGEQREPECVERLEAYARQRNARMIAVSGKLEEEIEELSPEERAEFLQAMGLERSALEELISAAYRLLALITFYTVTTDLQAWTVTQGTTAPEAAGKIHTDFQQGFIRAEVYHYDDLMSAGSEHAVREQGRLRSEGKEYVIRDGDIVHFLFSGGR